MFLLLDLGEIGIEALLVSLAMEGVHPTLALSLILPNLIVLDLE